MRTLVHQSPPRLLALGLGTLSFFLTTLAWAAVPWQAHGPFGGALADVAIDPEDGSVVFVASERGIFVSTNGGAAWSLAGADFAVAAPDAAVTTLALDSSPTDLVVWAGTDVAGLVVSTDGGATWNGTDLDTGLIYALLVDPMDSQQLWAGTDSGAERTTDGGATFASIGGLPTDPVLTLSLAADGALWAGNDAGEIYLSTDDGVTWELRDNGLPGSPVSSLVADPAAAGTLYAGTEDGVFTTTDGGATWTAATTGLTDLAIVALALDALSPSTLFAATEAASLFRSTDAAASWSPSQSGLTAMVPVAVAIDGSSSANVLVASEDAGCFRSSDGGGSWQEANQGLAVTEITSLAVTETPTPSVRLFAGSPGIGIYRSDDGGASWMTVNGGLGNLDVEDLAAEGDAAWAATDGGGVFRTTDGGASWQSTALAADEALQIERGADGSLWAGTDEDGVFLSSDDGASWIARSNGLTDLRVRVLAVDPRLASRLLAKTRDGLFRSVDAGMSWSLVTAGLGGADVEGLAFDPAQVSADGAWAATDLGVFRSNDGGATWNATAALPDPATVAVSVDPQGVLRVALELGGVYRSSDEGATWQLDAEGLEAPVLVLRDAEGATWSATAGGVYSREHDLFSDGFESGDLSKWISP